MNDKGYERQRSRRNSNYDTGKIPLTQSEREFQEKINRERYEQIIKKQQQGQPIVRRADIPRGSETDYVARTKQVHKQEKKQKEKKGCGCSTVFICFLLIIAISFAGIFGYGYSLCAKTDYNASGFNITAHDVMSDSQVYNVLLIGADKEDDGGTARSDTMLLVSVDRKTKTLKFTSFMRDMWVEIPDYGEAKLNAAFAYGGPELLIKTIQKNFKVKIDNYVMVDFEMFKQLIDGIGGVNVDITEAEARFINRTTHAHVEPGKNHLNGDYALIYCRIRKLDSDFNRTQRQRKVMSAIFEQIKTQSIFKTIDAAKSVLPLISTDISPFKMCIKAFGAVQYLTYGNEQLRLPLDDGYYNKTINGQAALVVDFEKNIEAIQNFIYG